MGAYMYPIKIKRKPQRIPFEKEIVLHRDILTLDLLRKHVGEKERFSVYRDVCSEYTTLTVYSSRLETEEELKIRVKKEEKYMENYTKFHDAKIHN